MAKVLVVDDSDFVRMRYRQLLANEGLEVVEAVNGQEAVEKYQALRPDLVLMDITMPVLDGLEALRAIRAADPEAAVVMSSAIGQQATVLEAIKAGAKDFIVKPLQPERLLETVRRLIG